MQEWKADRESRRDGFPDMIDIISQGNGIEVKFDGKTLWVNVGEQCRLRVGMIGKGEISFNLSPEIVKIPKHVNDGCASLGCEDPFHKGVKEEQKFGEKCPCCGEVRCVQMDEGMGAEIMGIGESLEGAGNGPNPDLDLTPNPSVDLKKLCRLLDMELKQMDTEISAISDQLERSFELLGKLTDSVPE